MNSTIGSKSPRATDDSPMAKPSGMPTSAPRNTPVSTRKTLIPTCSQSGTLRKPSVASCTSRSQVAPIGGQKKGSIQPKADASPQRPRSARHAPAIDQTRPESTALASPKRTVFCRVNGLSASPSQTASRARLPPLTAVPRLPMICSSMPQIIDSTSSRVRTNSGDALIARGSAAQRRAREGQAELALDPPGPRRHHDQPLAEEERLLDRVGDEHDRRAGLLPEPQHQPLHLLPGQRVERPERLVHQDHRAGRWRGSAPAPPAAACRPRAARPACRRSRVSPTVPSSSSTRAADLGRRPPGHARPEADVRRRPTSTRRARPAGTPCRGRRPARAPPRRRRRTRPAVGAGTPRGC